MNFNYYFSTLAGSFFFVLASPAKAAFPVPLYHLPFEKIRQNFQLFLPGGVKTAMTSKNGLQFVKEALDRRRISHVRMQQYYEGVPVFGGYAIMHSPHPATQLALSQSPVQMTGTLYANLEAELGQPPPEFLPKANTALEQFKKTYLHQLIDAEHVTPLVYIDMRNKAHWAYRVSLLIHSKNNMPEKPTAIIEAQSYKTLIQWNDIKAKRVPVQGAGYGGNIKTSSHHYGSGFPFLKLTHKEDTCFMENKSVMVINMDHQYWALKEAIHFPCLKSKNKSPIYNTGQNNDGYDEVNGAFSPSNDALYAGNVIKDMYYDWYKSPVLVKKDGKTPMPLVMRVHYGVNYENAYWDGKQMTFGDGGKRFYPLVSLGVAAHEISHGFTEQHAALNYYGESGGIDEAFSDIAAQAAEYYTTGKNSWTIGSEILKQDSGREALRYMDVPSKDGKSYDNATQYYAAYKKSPSSIEVHSTSGVFNHLFYILANQANWTLRKAFDVMVTANMYYWGTYASFQEAACGMIYAAKDLGYSVDDVKKSLNAVAIDYRICVV